MTWRPLEATSVRRVSSPARGAAPRQPTEHPLLTLQRTAGNRAVAQLIQRREKTIFSASVALAPLENIYSGKCDADLTAPAVRKTWSREVLGKETAVIFECGPASFRFSNFRAWFAERGPWRLDLADEGSAWVPRAIERALDDISDDDGDAGPAFWTGYHTIKSALKTDLDHFCRG